MNVIDAEWTQAGTSDPEQYSETCRRKRQRQYRRVGAFVERLVVGAVVCMTAAVLLAVMTGALH